MTRQEVRVFLQSWNCGCGSPEAAARFLYDVLATYHARAIEQDALSLFKPDDRPALERIWKQQAAALRELLPTDGIRYFVLYVLTEWDLLEHGGSVDGSWLTDKGKDVLAALEREQNDDFEVLTDASCVHGYAIDGGADEPNVCPDCPRLSAN